MRRVRRTKFRRHYPVDSAKKYTVSRVKDTGPTCGHQRRRSRTQYRPVREHKAPPSKKGRSMPVPRRAQHGSKAGRETAIPGSGKMSRAKRSPKAGGAWATSLAPPASSGEILSRLQASFPGHLWHGGGGRAPPDTVGTALAQSRRDREAALATNKCQRLGLGELTADASPSQAPNRRTYSLGSAAKQWTGPTAPILQAQSAHVRGPSRCVLDLGGHAGRRVETQVPLRPQVVNHPSKAQ